jgi:biotin operon repressor
VIDRIPPEKAVQLLKDDGIEVDVEQAKIILDFLYEMAEIVVDQYLNQAKIS